MWSKTFWQYDEEVIVEQSHGCMEEIAVPFLNLCDSLEGQTYTRESGLRDYQSDSLR